MYSNNQKVLETSSHLISCKQTWTYTNSEKKKKRKIQNQKWLWPKSTFSTHGTKTGAVVLGAYRKQDKVKKYLMVYSESQKKKEKNNWSVPEQQVWSENVLPSAWENVMLKRDMVTHSKSVELPLMFFYTDI